MQPSCSKRGQLRSLRTVPSQRFNIQDGDSTTPLGEKKVLICLNGIPCTSVGLLSSVRWGWLASSSSDPSPRTSCFLPILSNLPWSPEFRVFSPLCQQPTSVWDNFSWSIKALWHSGYSLPVMRQRLDLRFEIVGLNFRKIHSLPERVCLVLV